MEQKIFCPHCGRCLGECFGSDSTSSLKTLIRSPRVTEKKHFIHNMKCVKCKQEVFILMEFKD